MTGQSSYFLINLRDWLDRLLGHLALTGLVQVVELAPGVRPAADLSDLACRIG